MTGAATAFLYIGADNATGALDTARIESIMAGRHQGFTILPATGHYQGNREPSVVVLVSGDQDKICETARVLASELDQDSVGVQFLPAIQFVGGAS